MYLFHDVHCRCGSVARVALALALIPCCCCCCYLQAIRALGFAVDAFFLFDVILNFRTAFFDRRGALIRQPKRVATQ